KAAPESRSARKTTVPRATKMNASAPAKTKASVKRPDRRPMQETSSQTKTLWRHAPVLRRGRGAPTLQFWGGRPPRWRRWERGGQSGAAERDDARSAGADVKSRRPAPRPRAPAGETEPAEADQHHRPGRNLRRRNRIGRAGQHVIGEIGGERVPGGGRILAVPEQILAGVRAFGPGRLEVPGQARARDVGKAETGGEAHDRLSGAEHRRIEYRERVRPGLERLDPGENILVELHGEFAAERAAGYERRHEGKIGNLIVKEGARAVAVEGVDRAYRVADGLREKRRQVEQGVLRDGGERVADVVPADIERVERVGLGRWVREPEQGHLVVETRNEQRSAGVGRSGLRSAPGEVVSAR